MKKKKKRTYEEDAARDIMPLKGTPRRRT